MSCKYIKNLKNQDVVEKEKVILGFDKLCFCTNIFRP